MEFTGERYIPEQSNAELYDEHVLRYEFAKQFAKNKIVLDAACGEGYGSNLLASQAQYVYGIDLSVETIESAKSKYKNGNMEFICASIEQLPLEDHLIDTIVSFETIEHVSVAVQQNFFKEVKRVLKPDGMLVISTPNKAIYSDLYNYKNDFHVKEFYIDEFEKELRQHFSHVVMLEQSFEIVSMIYAEQVQMSEIQSQKLQNAKYVVGVCSDREIDISQMTGSSALAKSENYLKLRKRILQLQDEEESRNKHIAHLDKEIEFCRTEVTRLNIHIENLSAWGQSLDSENTVLKNERENNLSAIAELNTRIADKETEITHLMNIITAAKQSEEQLQQQIDAIKTELNDKQGHIELLLESERKLQRQVQELQTDINNKQGHIELLLESDRKLEQIYQSTGWKVLTKCYGMRDSLFPQGSKRRFVLKLAKNFIKKPGVYLRKLNWANVKKLRYYAAAEGMDNLSNRLDAFDEKYTETQTELVEVQQVEVQKQYETLVFPKVENPIVSIIIPVYNQFHYTYACLKSILENTQDVSYEVIIADDVSTDKTMEIGDIIKNITVVRNEQNLRFLLNCNNAARYARGKYIHFLNNDTQVQEKWLSSLVQLIESDESIGMVGSKLVYPDGRLQEAGGILWRDGSAWNYGNGADPSAPEYNYVKEADYISGASIMISKKLWEQLGGFDEHFVPAYCEDSDLAFTVRKAGYKVMYQPLSVVVHCEGVSNGTDLDSGLKAYQVENSKKFYEKWKDVLEAEHYPNAENVFTARDKSREKKCVLIVDHYVPHFDKDAGSKTVYQYIKLFCQSGYNVKFIGDNFYRHEPYTTILEQLGVEVLVGNYYANHWKDWVKANAKHIDFVFLNRPHIAVNYIDFIRKNTNAKIMYYGMDLHFLREMREYELTGNQELKKSAEEWKKKELDIMRSVDVVYYLSEVEISIIHELDSTINANLLPIYIFEMIDKLNYNSTQRKDLMFIGGFVHRPNADAVLWFHDEIWPIVKGKNKNIKIFILGSNPPDEIKNLNSEDFIIKGFVSDEELDQIYSQIRLSVVPLRYGAGIKGKVVEAMQHQVPVITTTVGAEGLDVEGKVLCVEDEASLFANRIIELYDDAELLADYSKREVKFINDNFTIAAAKKILDEDFK